MSKAKTFNAIGRMQHRQQASKNKCKPTLALSALARCSELTKSSKSLLCTAAKSAVDLICAGQISVPLLREVSYFASMSLLLCVKLVKTDGTVMANRSYEDLRDSLGDAVQAQRFIHNSWKENPAYKPDADIVEILTIALGIYEEFLNMITYQQLNDAEAEWEQISKKVSQYKHTQTTND